MKNIKITSPLIFLGVIFCLVLTSCDALTEFFNNLTQEQGEEKSQEKGKSGAKIGGSGKTSNGGSGKTSKNSGYRKTYPTSVNKATHPNSTVLYGLIEHEGKLLRIGGRRNADRKSYSEVWSSTDGFRWEELTPKTDEEKKRAYLSIGLFEPRYSMQVFKVGNQLFMASGYSDTKTLNLGIKKEDVPRMKDHLLVPKGREIEFVGHDDDLWIAIDGGKRWGPKSGTFFTNKSFPHKSFNRLTEGRTNAAVVNVDEDTVLIIGGDQEPEDITKDVYEVVKGGTVNNRYELPEARTEAAAVNFNGDIYVIGGIGGGTTRYGGSYGKETRGILVSSDGGKTWSELSTRDELKRSRHVALVFDEKIFVIGGYTTDNLQENGRTWLNDVWSFDGKSWSREGELPPSLKTNFSQASASYYYRGAVFNNRIFFIGEDRTWVSDDGKNWSDSAQTFE